MKIKAQIGMVLNLDKCIGCHTCSVTCKNTWTNRPGAEYMWFNNVETKPGVGYPKRWEDEGHYKGGWELNSKGKLQLRAGNKLNKVGLGKIFYNPDMPELDDYYEPWTYDYQTLFGPEKSTSRLLGQSLKSPVRQWTSKRGLTGMMIWLGRLNISSKTLIWLKLKPTLKQTLSRPL